MNFNNLFKLDGFMEGTDEFGCKCDPAHPEADIDKDTTAAKQTSIPVPNKVTLDEDTYNEALKALKASFKEASEVIDMISSANVITEKVDKDDKQMMKKRLKKIAKVLNKIAILAKEPEKSDEIKKLFKKYANKGMKQGEKLCDYFKKRDFDDEELKQAFKYLEKLQKKLQNKYPELENIPVGAFDDLDATIGTMAVTAHNAVQTEAVDEMVDGIFDSIFESSDDESGYQMTEAQQKYVEAVETEYTRLIMEAFDDGVFYEAVDRSDKEAVKKLVKSLRPKIKQTLKESKIRFFKPDMIARTVWKIIPTILPTLIATIVPIDHTLITAASSVSATVALTGHSREAISLAFSQHLWQLVGAVALDNSNINVVVEKINELYASELGEYHILYMAVPATFIDQVFKGAGANMYFLFIDNKKKLDDKTKKFIQNVNKAMADAEKEKAKGDTKEDDSNKDDVKTESYSMLDD